MFLFKKSPEKQVVKKYKSIVERINRLEEKYEGYSDEQIKKEFLKLKEEISKIEDFKKQQKALDKVLEDVFAMVREAAKRTLKQRHFDVQLIGGIVMHKSGIAEMKTGEGKTLTATLTASLNALTGRGVHIVTVNDYLAKRDAVWMGQIYHFLGLKTACLQHEHSYLYDPSQTTNLQDEIRDKTGAYRIEYSFLKEIPRKQAYQADILCGTNSEFGFDYLRDNMVYDLEQQVQRELHFAIIDEVDSILIDEARTPLIISAPDEEATKLYKEFAKIAKILKEEEDFKKDEKDRVILLTEQGIHKVEKILNIKNLYLNPEYVRHLDLALKAEYLYHKDVDYVVRNNEIIIVDEFTGRLMFGRRYSEGLHQAIEAKEGVLVKQESRTLATITIQNYFRMYKKLAGMTGTAYTERDEFRKIYGLNVEVIPTNKPMIRKDHQDVIYKTEKAKFKAIVECIKEKYKKGQPVLVGTISIEKNEYLSKLLEKEGIPHQVLNAKHHEKEAQIIAQAGKLKAVTVATNMAGRGVDIVLGGNPPSREEAEKVKKLGGLFVLGTERHEARRIDNQLRGRSGRQGDPGESQFFISLEDNLMRIFAGDRIKALMERLNFPDNTPIQNKMITKLIEQAQKKVETYNFDIRKRLLEFDDVLNKQRQAIYSLRRNLLIAYKKGFNNLVEFLERYLDQFINKFLKTQDSLIESRRKIIEEILNIKDINQIKEELIRKIDELKNNVGEKEVIIIIKNIFLNIIDKYWVLHLDLMEGIRTGIHLKGYANKDPLVEYKREGFKKFQDLLFNIAIEFLRIIFNLEIKEEQKVDSLRESEDTKKQEALKLMEEFKTKYKRKIKRNDPCPCGSGKKWKKCHGKYID